jgi:hypothetical protein
MASHDYYSSFPSNNAHPQNRTDAPLPPAPGNHSMQSISPVMSPFDDHSRYDYPSTSHQNLAQNPAPLGYGDTTYHGASDHNIHGAYQPASHNGDPFADQNAIPLRTHGKMDASSTRYETDPEGNPYAPGPVPRKSRKKGWFKGRVTWVVYILTLVQVGVFVGELIKNGVSRMLQFCAQHEMLILS